MKKLFFLLTILVLALCLAACTQSEPIEANASETPVVTDEPVITEAPTTEPTEVPTEAPTPEPTDTPAPTAMPTEVPVTVTPLPEGDFFMPIRNDLPYIVDMDGDGQDDIVLVQTEEVDEYYTAYTIIITRASDPDSPYTERVEQGWGFMGAVADLDPSNPQKELFICFDQEDGDPLTTAVRLKDDGSDFEAFIKPIEVFDGSVFHDGFPEDYVFKAEEGIPFGVRTEILGTHFVRGRLTVTGNGIEVISDEYTYYPYELKLRRDLKLTLDSGKTVTAKKGSVITTYSTDLETYVKVMLKDGTIGKAKVTFDDPEDHYPIYINGIEQDEYAEMPYAD